MDSHALVTVWVLSAIGLCLCQNDLQVDAPPYGEAGQRVEFTITNPPPPPFFIVTWRLKGGNIVVNFNGVVEKPTNGYIGRVSVSNTTGSLELRQLTVNDTGIYTVSIQSGSIVREGEKSLTVFEKISDVHITHPGDVLIANKNSVNLTCDARGSIVTREWTKDEQPLSSNRITFHEENRRVSISPVQKEDNGEYTCQVRNPVSSLHNVSKLIVNYGPENTKIEVKGEIVLGSQITLTCSAESIPDSTYTWTFNEIEIQSGASYVIQESADEDSGNYTCTALNSITKLRNTAIQELKIQEKPNGLSTGAIVGIVIGVIIILAAVSGLTFYFVKKKGKMGAPKPHQARTINGSVELNYADISHFQRKNVQRVDQGNGGNGETLYSGVRLPSSPAGPTSGQGPTYADINFQNNAAGMRPTLGHGGNVGDQSTVYAAVKPKGQAPRPPHQVPDVTYAQVRK
ncbi:cell adhesion molecule CEACAM6-like isoform X3 [Alosa pseudoharengus]|uniref:cell adhesion molecule CEACAM6-like isoform X3 n=1 Tax=Alosa pseudoharengus TaxID=34774 RepID=UPI003F8B733A